MQIKIGTFIFISNIQKVGEALPLNENLKNCGLSQTLQFGMMNTGYIKKSVFEGVS